MGIDDLCSNRRALRKYLRCSMAVEQKKLPRNIERRAGALAKSDANHAE
jgi:hypothetical protein